LLLSRAYFLFNFLKTKILYSVDKDIKKHNNTLIIWITT